MSRQTLALIGASLLAHPAFADASYQDKTQITGGSLVGLMKLASRFSSSKASLDEPQTAIVTVHGNRMARVNQNLVQIIDLDQKTFTNVDNQNHRYEVITFADYEKKINELAKKMQTSNRDAQQRNELQVTYKVQVQNTGAVRQVNGLDAKEAVITVEMDAAGSAAGQPGAVAMTMTSDTWLANDPPGYAEVRQFNERMSKELAINLDTSFANSFLAMRGGSSQGLAQLQSESAKLSGAPVLQIVRLAATKDTKSAAPSDGANGGTPQATSIAPQGGDHAVQSTTIVADATRGASLASISGGLGGLTGFIKQRAISQLAASAKPEPASRSSGDESMLDMHIEKSQFSAEPAVLSVFEIPAGYARANR